MKPVCTRLGVGLLCLLVASGCEEEEPSTETGTEETGEEEELLSFEVTGQVLDGDGGPVFEALVRVGGRPETDVLTDADGMFTLWYTEIGLGEPAIVAAKQGYRAKGVEFFKPETPVTLILREVKGPDNLEYVYQDPGDGEESMNEDCSHCHTSFVAEFLSSKHSQSAMNPLVQDLYAGVTVAYEEASSCEAAGGVWATGVDPGTEDAWVEKCYLGGGVLPDLNENCGGLEQGMCDASDLQEEEFPVAFGACADCHAPGIDGVAGGRDLHEAVGLAYDIGVHCDVCHKVADIDMSQPPGVGQRLVMGRPSEPGKNTFVWDPVFYGPLPDVPNVIMGGSPQPKFNESQFCAGCHQQEQEALLPGDSLDRDRWPDGLPVHDTYAEWQRGPYNQEATQCQWCHMPANMERTNGVDIASVENQSITFGFPREPENIRRHIFRSPLQGEPRLIDGSVYVSLQTSRDGQDLLVSASVANVGCGHAIPTGEPMRALVLVVEASGDCGSLEPIGGMTIADVGAARAQGVVGEGLTSAGVSVSWAAGAAAAKPGDVLRVVSPTGQFDDYEGVGLFADTALGAEEKGMEILAPVGFASVISVEGDTLLLEREIAMDTGDVVYVGDPAPETWEDGDNARYLAGMAGSTFSKVLLDAGGQRNVAHYKAVDIASDNRISPGQFALTNHRFDVPGACTSGEVTATVLYRPVPLAMAVRRGWESRDYTISAGSTDW